MADALEKFKAEVTRLVGDLRATQAKSYAIVEELLQVLEEGGAGPNYTKAVMEAFARLWAQRYPGEKYLFTFKKDAPAAKRLWRALGVDELEARMRRYFASTDGFVTSKRHPFAVFVATVNTYVAAPERIDRLLGCDHEPPCKSEAACTKRRMAAVNGSPF